ncbi:mitochondrial genome maintenance exonuclease 1 [Echeneis naucrates]|uniref:Mitochondrial genome maintenance exonuclease 1 n=1 Tax=Echeneis naucrates TaxID=173247 RepID=A0A665W319_ECHNA|nr:mitochondrial genome maintenance exonuclease 1 [Echeneis naucrates]
MLVFKRMWFVRGASLPVRTLFTGYRLSSPKRRSPYNFSNSERYSALVKSVMSFRVSSQNPESLLAEDDHLYGPVIASPPSSKSSGTAKPEATHPFLNSSKTPETEEPVLGFPARILLNREQGRTLVPSVSRILQQTLSPEQIFHLERWKRRMIAELGEDGFQEYSQNLFRQGKRFHSVLEDFLTLGATWKDKSPAETPEDSPEVQGYMQSVSHILEDISAVRAIESTVQHDALNYLGIVDCVARYRGVLCVIDWKTSEKPKPFLGNTYDNPIQVAAYTGALNSDGNYKYQVENGLIVVAYKDGSPAHAHQLNSELLLEYWKKWLLRLEEFKSQRSNHVTSAFSEKR